MKDDEVPDVIIHHVAFDHREGVIEVSYAEVRDQADGVGMVKTVILERALFEDEVNEIESDLRDLVDEGVLALRNEDAHKRRLDKANTRYAPGGEDDDED